MPDVYSSKVFVSIRLREHYPAQVPDGALVLTCGVDVQGDRLEALYRLAIASGLRQGELLGLRWQDVEMSARPW